MKATIRTQDIILDIDALDETILETEMDDEGLAPEVLSETEVVAAWETAPDVITQLVPFMPFESEETITEQLVRAGNEEADLEQREAADELE